ncbi:hypothetical protein CDAR_265801 [Caerostris darwini]|uniref:Uncharacterized protein n=1 Tax=Caerostris darwini TaxID=1538125 RepID=A0AAV4V880_9ARAC|nr:hypothetical protein CDAR_265801 [Caerostris darwini]
MEFEPPKDRPSCDPIITFLIIVFIVLIVILGKLVTGLIWLHKQPPTKTKGLTRYFSKMINSLLEVNRSLHEMRTKIHGETLHLAPYTKLKSSPYAHKQENYSNEITNRTEQKDIFNTTYPLRNLNTLAHVLLNSNLASTNKKFEETTQLTLPVEHSMKVHERNRSLQLIYSYKKEPPDSKDKEEKSHKEVGQSRISSHSEEESTASTTELTTVIESKDYDDEEDYEEKTKQTFNVSSVGHYVIPLISTEISTERETYTTRKTNETYEVTVFMAETTVKNQQNITISSIFNKQL